MNFPSHLNAFFYIAGSCLFIVGSILFHPHYSATLALYKTGVCTFTLGSLLFGLAALQQLLKNFQSISSEHDGLINECKPFDMDLAVSLCRDTIASISGLLFIVGSAAFWPSFAHGGALVGNWLYRCGASLGVVNSLWSLIRLQKKSAWFSTLKVMALLSLLGSIGFLIGGVYFLCGDEYDAQGSYGWLFGSIAFLLSSALIYGL